MEKHPYPVGPGWWPLLDEKLPELKELAGSVDIKEKYGACRVNYTIYNRKPELLIKLSDLSRSIERASTHICENCGAARKKPEKWYPWCERCKAASHEMRKLIRTETAEKYFDEKRKELWRLGIRELADKKMLDDFDKWLDQQEGQPAGPEGDGPCKE